MPRTPRPSSRPSARAGRSVLALLAVAAPAAAVAQGVVPEPPRAPSVPVPPALAVEATGPGGACGRAVGRGGGRRPAAPPVSMRPRGPARGYLGVRLSEVAEVRWTDEGPLVRYCAYPLVVSVEPASPAERAGVGAGDTLVAYGARDLVRDGPIAIDRLLVPGERVRVRLRRDGRTLTRAVVVSERPGGVAGPGWPDRGWPGREWRMPRPAPRWARDPGAHDGADGGRAERDHPEGARGADAPGMRVRVFTPGRVVVAPPAAGHGGAPDVEQLVLDAFGRDGFAPGAVGRDVLERARAGEAPWVTYLKALPPLPTRSWGTFGPAALAGAQLVALDDDLRDAVTGAPPRGVFVLQVLPGTPAAEAGLRAGDVIVAAAGRPVHTPAALQRALASRAAVARRRERADGAERALPDGDGRAVALRVARGGAARDVVLRW